MPTYEFIIKNDNPCENESPLAGEPQSLDLTTQEGQREATIKSLVAVNKFVKPFVTQAISHRVGTVQLRTGSQELQDKVNFAYQTITHVASFAESVATGWLVTGNPIGAVIGGAVSILTTVYGYAQNLQTINLQKNLENMSLDMARERAGGLASYSNSRGNKQ